MVITRRNLLLGTGAALAAGSLAPTMAAAASPGLARPTDIPLADLITVSRAPTRQNFVALTFDDGPHPRLTPLLLDVLKDRRIHATFFVIGRSAARYPDILKRMADEGHEIGNHSWQHPRLTGLGRGEILNEIDRTSEVVFKAVQRMPVLLRPPYGKLSATQARMVHDERAMPTILWSLDPEDWRRPGPEVVAERIVGRSHSGAIILSHDIHSGTIAAMPSVIDGLKDQGYRFATVSTILGHRDWSTLRWRLPPVEG